MLNVDKTRKAVKLWTYAAWSLPLIALVLVLSSWLFGLETLESIILVSIVTVFSVAVFIWWWWATFTIYDVVKVTDSSIKKLDSVNERLGAVGTFMRKVTKKRRKDD